MATTTGQSEGSTTTADMARVSICDASSNINYNFKITDINTETLSIAFNIPDLTKFFLVDQDNNVEFASKNGTFDLDPSKKYQVQISKKKQDKGIKSKDEDEMESKENDKININTNNGDGFESILDKKELSIMVSGNKDGRSTGKGAYLAVHNYYKRDKRDGASFYVMCHSNKSKQGIWKFHSFNNNNKNNSDGKLYTIECFAGYKIASGHWLSVHGSYGKDKRDNESMYCIISNESRKATIWQLSKCNDHDNSYYISVFGNKDGRKIGQGYYLSVHSSDKNDVRDKESLFVHVRCNNHKATQWNISIQQK